MAQLDNVAAYPTPDNAAIKVSDQLVATIKQRIEQHLPAIPFQDYMTMALYEPGLGYYSAGSQKFGDAGDFVTAPEISPLFSRCVARQCADVIQELDAPVVFELGAGSGVMARDIINELRSLEQLPDAYWILEPAADLRQRQQALLQDTVPWFFDRIVWLDALPQEQYDGVVLANEVVDALPVTRFCKSDDSFKELSVGLADTGFTWMSVDPGAELLLSLQQLEAKLPNPMAHGYVSEINPGLGMWLSAVTEHLQQGLMLVVDYGYTRHEYYHPDRSEGTLLCYYRHRAHNDPFLFPGLQDITASVDFTSLAESAVNCGLEVRGYTTQAYFLMASGLQEMLIETDQTDARQLAMQSQQVRTLTMPGEMGERVKVMALCRNLKTLLRGFVLADQRARL